MRRWLDWEVAHAIIERPAAGWLSSAFDFRFA